MKDFVTLLQHRRSYRKFTSDKIELEDLKAILSAGLMSPTSKNQTAWHFVVVDDAAVLEKLSKSKARGSQFLKNVPLAIAIAADSSNNDCWIEDCSIAAISMQYQAMDLEIGSCWVQMRARTAADGTPADEMVQDLLDIPENMKVLCVIGFGYFEEKLPPHDDSNLKWDQVHQGKF